MPTNFHIPRQTDREIIAAMGRIRDSVKPLVELTLFASIPRGTAVTVPADGPEGPGEAPQLRNALDLNSCVLDHIYLQVPSGHTALIVRRTLDAVSDVVGVQDEWPNNLPENIRSQAWMTILSNAQKELRAADIAALFKGQEDNAWNRYRDAQAAVVNSLQQTSETLLIKVAERNTQLDRDRDERFASLEKKLRDELAEQKATLEKQVADQRAVLGQREKALADREAAFETKESRYVARQKQGEQIKQIQDWLNDWHLTEGTRKKRTPIFYAYISALVLTGGLTAYSISHSYDLIKTADDLAKLQWWHWVSLTLKTLLPLAAFTTFMVYFIRWTGDWAYQHAKEEFRNRTLLIDIGRSSWLLEAVRDAHERNKEIPADLLKELSRNLFANTPGTDSELHPQAAADILLQGLSSLRVKSGDGTEVEAKRGK